MRGGGAPENNAPAGFVDVPCKVKINQSMFCCESFAFTLAEVLITLGIIGIVAAMTLPTVINKAERFILAQQFKKTYANLQNAINLVAEDYGASHECYNTAYGSYHTTECKFFWKSFLAKMNIVKTCNSGANRCRPAYKSKAQVLAEGGQVKNTACTMTLPGKVYYFADGAMINFQDTSVFFIIDINGFKGPNKWGWDVFYVNLNKKNIKENVLPLDVICGMKEKGGMYFSEMILK